MKTNIIRDKTFAFAVNIVTLHKYLMESKKEYVLSRQVLRSGTSIGANVKEAIFGSSRKDFINKMNIALKEAAETEYWLELLIATNYVEAKEQETLMTECREIRKILTSIVKTTRETD